jgi:flavin-dependent dehydrogenase
VSEFDLVIAGGGPVGLVTAIAGAARGLSAVVIERNPGLPEKACGEGLMPGAVRALAELGIELSDGVEFCGIRFVDGVDVASAQFPGLAGRALSRRALMQRLDLEARARGAHIWSGHALRDFTYSRGVVRAHVASVSGGERIVSGRLLVAADGLRSPIRRRLGYELPPRYPPRYGVQRHFRCAPWSPWVEVHWHERAEAYVTPLGVEEVGVAVLTHGRPASHAELMRLFPQVERRLARATEPGRVRGAGPLEQRTRSVLAPGVALVGDAAGYLDALSGEGLALGFRAAVALVTRFSDGDLWRYPRDHADIGRAYYALTHFMLFLARRPALRRSVLRYAIRHPEVFSDLLAIAADARSRPASHIGALLTRLLRLSSELSSSAGGGVRQGAPQRASMQHS